MPNDLAKQTISTIQGALENNSSATAINDVIQIIQELASKAFSISVSELSTLISKDPSVTEKVISSANTLGFNPGGSQITTITQAIHTIGFEKIRNLSISILLVENAGKNLNSDEQKEMAAMSISSGLMAQELVGQVGSNISPEFAFVCSSLRNYGKLLMTTFLVDDYREAKAIASKTTDYDGAFTRVFGLTPLMLGQILLQSSNLPKSIMDSLKEVSPEILEQASNTEDNQACLLADFCVKVCETTFDNTIPPERFNESIETIIGKFEKCLPVTLDMVNMSLIQIDASVTIFNRTVGLHPSKSPLATGIKARISGKPLPSTKEDRPPSQSKIPDKPSTEEIKKKAAEEHHKLSENKFKATMNMLLRELQPGDQICFKEIYNSVIETVQCSLDVDSCMVFVEEEDEKNLFAARYGIGDVFKKVRNRPVISHKNRDVFTICLNKKEDILIQDITVGKISSVIPDWLNMYSDTKSIALLPLLNDKQPYALIVCTGKTNQPIKLDKNDLRRLKSMRFSLSKIKKQLDQGTITSR